VTAPGGVYGYAAGVSDDGSIVIGSSNKTSGDYEAFRWTSGGGMVGLGDLAGGAFESEARAISADGLTIVGTGRNPSGETEAWIATIPEPSTALLVSLGLFGLAKTRRQSS
jgi:probable HAF family extracellular repeat protein